LRARPRVDRVEKRGGRFGGRGFEEAERGLLLVLEGVEVPVEGDGDPTHVAAALHGDEIRRFAVLEERILSRRQSDALIRRERSDPKRVVLVVGIGKTDESGEIARAFYRDDFQFGSVEKVSQAPLEASSRPTS